MRRHGLIGPGRRPGQDQCASVSLPGAEIPGHSMPLAGKAHDRDSGHSRASSHGHYRSRRCAGCGISAFRLPGRHRGRSRGLGGKRCRCRADGSGGFGRELHRFLDDLALRPPLPARIDQMDVRVDSLRGDWPPRTPRLFEIRSSSVSADRRADDPGRFGHMCARVVEIGTPGQRRHAYPFTNCTNCGPRWSIIRRSAL